MIAKIISGGALGAESAAIDTAIRLEIPYGGFARQGDAASTAYGLAERSFQSTLAAAEANMGMAEGMLVLTWGPPGPELTRVMVAAHSRGIPHSAVDMANTAPFQAGVRIRNWLEEKGVGVLWVTGTRAGEAPHITDAAGKALYTAFMLTLGSLPDDPLGSRRVPPPSTVSEAVQLLVDALPLKDRVAIAKMSTGELEVLNGVLGDRIRKVFRPGAGNRSLSADAARMAGRSLDPPGVSALIISELAAALAKSHLIRRI